MPKNTANLYQNPIANQLCERNSENNFSEQRDIDPKELKFIDKCLVAAALAAERKGAKRISKDIALFFLEKDRMAAFLVYLHMLHSCSGKVRRTNFPAIAKSIKTKESNVFKRVKQLVELGFVEDRGNGWFFCLGTKRWNMHNGICHAQMVDVPEKAKKDIRTIRNFCRTVQMELAKRKAASKQSEKGCGTVNRLELSISYISRYAGMSERTVCRHKKQAKKNGMMKFRKRHKVVETGPADMIAKWKEETPDRTYFVKRTRPGTFALCKRTVSTVESGLFMKKKRIWYSGDEKEVVLMNFTHRNFVPANFFDSSTFVPSETPIDTREYNDSTLSFTPCLKTERKQPFLL